MDDGKNIFDFLLSREVERNKILIKAFWLTFLHAFLHVSRVTCHVSSPGGVETGLTSVREPLAAQMRSLSLSNVVIQCQLGLEQSFAE